MNEHNSYFIRHTKVAVSDDTLRKLWDQNKVAIHFPGDGPGPDLTSLNPQNYEGRDATAIKNFATLAEKGGYVWAETRVRPAVKVGRVEPGTPVEYLDTTWTETPNPRYQHRVGSEAVLKTLQLTDVTEVATHEAMSLRAARPIGAAVVRWEACGSRLAALVKGEPVERIWRNLSPDRQETACAEFLRCHQNRRYPKLKFLLMPVGRTLKDVDIYAMDETGTEIFAQVTFYMKKHPEARRKREKLRQYKGTGSRMLLFCRFLDNEREPLRTSLPEPVEEHNVLFIPAEEVLAWIRDNPDYEDKLFSI